MSFTVNIKALQLYSAVFVCEVDLEKLSAPKEVYQEREIEREREREREKEREKERER